VDEYFRGPFLTAAFPRALSLQCRLSSDVYMPMDFATVIQVINLLGLIILAVFMKRWIDALKGTVDTQQQTIAALKSLMDASDTPAMLKRFESYRRLVDHEKQAIQENFERALAEQKIKISESQIETGNLFGSVYEIASRLMPYVPIEDRQKLLETSDIAPALIKPLARLADEAPYAPKIPVTLWYANLIARRGATVEEREK